MDIEARARELLANEYAMADSTKRADKIIAGFDCAPGTEHAIRAIVAALTPPEGFVLVPVEPTDGMIHAAANARAGGGASYEVWHAMLAARPEVSP